jgi:deoxyribodipyrimidine photo-lyase
MARSDTTPAHIVWFKRDLRVHDHHPLVEAAQRGPVLPLYIVEPSVLRAPDFDSAHWTFIKASLEALSANLAALGQPLVVRVGEAVPVLDSLKRQHPIAGLWAHEETGNWLTYQRDIAVRRWARQNGVPFTEIPQNGVVRGLRDRTGWQNLWEQRMRQPLAAAPAALQPVTLKPGRIPDHAQLRLRRDRRSTQPGGEAAAMTLVQTFLDGGARWYLKGLADPSAAWESCSRLSPHLAYGTLSLRYLVQATRKTVKALKRVGDSAESDRLQLLRSLNAFESRLHWRCHFMQKLESEPEIEFHNFVRALDGIREPAFSQAHFDAWCAGKTGYPLVDAAMRALTATGWLNFRLRAMLVSFAAYDLWLHWREPALHLARLFVDYEPGIHYSQMQMQSGTTGINTMRVYDPTKQALERDPHGAFIRRWLPELTDVPALFIHEPWRMPPSVQREAGCRIGSDYPAPIVDHATASKRAVARLHQVRNTPEAQAQIAAVLEKHGSRRPRRQKRAVNRPKTDPIQLEMDLGE